MEISFIRTQNLVHSHVNFHMKGFAPGLALKERRKTTQKSPIEAREWVHKRQQLLTSLPSLIGMFSTDFYMVTLQTF